MPPVPIILSLIRIVRAKTINKDFNVYIVLFAFVCEEIYYACIKCLCEVHGRNVHVYGGIQKKNTIIKYNIIIYKIIINNYNIIL